MDLIIDDESPSAFLEEGEAGIGPFLVGSPCDNLISTDSYWLYLLLLS